MGQVLHCALQTVESSAQATGLVMGQPHDQFSQLRLDPGMAKRVDAPSGLLGGVRLLYAHPSLAPTLQLFPDFLSASCPISSFGEGQVSVLSVPWCSALRLAYSKQLIHTEWISESLSYKTQKLTALQN